MWIPIADLNPPACEFALPVACSPKGIVCTRESNEESVSLGVHLDARVVLKGSAQYTAVRSQNVYVFITEVVEQASGAPQCP